MTKIMKRVVCVVLAALFVFSFPIVASANAPYMLSADLYYDDTYVENAQTIGATSADVVSSWGYDILKSARIDAIVPFDLKKGDILTLSFNVSNYSHYDSITPKYYYFQETSTGAKLTYNSWTFDSVDYSSGKGVIKLTAIQDFLSTGNNQLHIGVEFNCDCSCADVAEFHIRNIDFNKETAEAIQSNSILSWFQRLFDKVGNGFTELKVKIETTISSLSSNIDGWGQSIVNWFSSIGTQLTDMKSSIKTWFNGLGDRISGFFDNLSSNISGFFNSLFNKIWFGNEDGESSYQEPTFNSGVYDVLITLDTYYERLEDTKTQIDTSKEEISTYIEDGTSFLDDVIGVFPASVLALLSFGVVLLFVRKVVGR